MRIKIIFMMLTGVSILTSCHRKKPIEKNEEVKKEIQIEEVKEKAKTKELKIASNEWNTFSAKMNIDYESENNPLPLGSFSGTLKMEKNKYIIISINAPFIGEVGRILVTQDSVKILDRVKRKYSRKSFSYMQNFTSVPLTLSRLQSILLANPLVDYTSTRMDTADGNIISVFEDVQMRNTMTVSLLDFFIRNNAVLDIKKNYDLNISYSEFNEVQGRKIPIKISFTSQKPDKINAGIEYEDYSLDQPVTLDFKVPSGYGKE